MELSELSKKRLEGVDERLKAIVIENNRQQCTEWRWYL